jgi:hypothetical protein
LFNTYFKPNCTPLKIPTTFTGATLLISSRSLELRSRGTVNAKRKDIAARVEGLTLRLFRRHVCDASDDDAGTCRRAGLACDIRVCGVGQLRQAEVRELGIAVLGHEDVRRLDVTVQNADGVRRRETAPPENFGS